LDKRLSSREKYLERASKTYHAQFLAAENRASSAVIAGKKYLTEHGIGTRAIAEKYRLGVVIDPLAGDDSFTGWLAIPFLSPNGVKAIRFRNLTPDAHPKYMQHPGQPVRLFNTVAIFTAGDTIGIAEGEIDAIAATERLGMPTLGVPGAEMWSAHKNVWTSLFKNYPHVLILRDGDKAGKDLADAIGDSLKLRARAIHMPSGEDVSSMVAAGRAEELIKQFRRDDDDSL
jgi:hypothetical protein